jgi:hypothetical protein
MKCKCSSLPDLFYLAEGPQGFEKGLTKLDAKDWMKFLECPECGDLWAVDEKDIMDKRFLEVVCRIKSRDEWPTTIPTQKRKQLLLASRGSTTDQKCVWKDCDKNQVKGVFLCIDHLYEAGASK